MLYIKTKNGERHEITGSNVYSYCPECGKEVQVDQEAMLNSIAQHSPDEMADVPGFSAMGQYCRACSDRHARETAARYEAEQAGKKA